MLHINYFWHIQHLYIWDILEIHFQKLTHLWKFNSRTLFLWSFSLWAFVHRCFLIILHSEYRSCKPSCCLSKETLTYLKLCLNIDMLYCLLSKLRFSCKTILIKGSREAKRVSFSFEEIFWKLLKVNCQFCLYQKLVNIHKL